MEQPVVFVSIKSLDRTYLVFAQIFVSIRVFNVYVQLNRDIG